MIRYTGAMPNYDPTQERQPVTKSVSDPKVTGIDAKILAAITRAANGSSMCPTNSQIANLIGWHSVSSSAKAIYRLQKRKLIRVVERTKNFRVIEIVSTGRRTARRESR